MRRRQYRLWAGVLAGATLVMTRLPLVNLIGFEFAVVTAFLIAYAAGCLSATRFVERRCAVLRGHESPGSPVFVLWPVGLANLLLLVPPFLLMSINSLITDPCDYAEGVAFFLLLPVVTALLATAVGAGCGVVTRWPGRACLLFIGYTVLTYGIGVVRLLTQPPVFAYNPIIGYFPGPLYDEVVRITPTLLIARGLALLQGVAVAAGLAVFIDPAGWNVRLRRFIRPLRWPDEAGQSAARWCLMGAVIGLAAAYLYRAPLGLVIDRAYIQRTLGGHVQTPHFDIYYDLNSETARNIARIAQDHEFRYDQLTRFLRVTATRRIQSYLYRSPDQKKRLMGARYTSLERPWDDEMHLNDEAFPHPILKHELAHVLASAFGNRLYGGSDKMGLHEGLAVAADWGEEKLTPHQSSRAMRQLGLAPSLDRVIGTFGFWTEAADRSYTLCGSFVRFLIDQYGIEAFKRAFPSGDFDRVYDKPLAVLIREWTGFLDRVPLSDRDLQLARNRFSVPSLFRRRCAHQVAALDDQGWEHYRSRRYWSAVQTFDQLRRLDPQNPSGLRGLLRATYRVGAYERTENVAREILARPDRPVSLRADAYQARGDVAWTQGRLDRAREEYRQAFRLHASDGSDREALVKLASLERPAVARWVFEYLLADQEQGTRVVFVREAVDREPDFAVGFYLIGRRLFNADAYPQALVYLRRAETASLSDSSLVIENERLIGLSLFYAGEYEQAIRVFQELAVRLPSTGLAHWAQDWAERCRWVQAGQKGVGAR